MKTEMSRLVTTHPAESEVEYVEYEDNEFGGFYIRAYNKNDRELWCTYHLSPKFMFHVYARWAMRKRRNRALRTGTQLRRFR